MTYTIGQAAARMQLSPSTLRYYDQQGLLPFLERAPSGVRVFTESDLGWLTLIECLKKAGLSIREIRRYMELYRQGDETLQERCALFHERRQVVEEELEQLRQTLEFLQYKCRLYDDAVRLGSLEAAQELAADKR